MLTPAHPVPSLAVIHPKKGWNKKELECEKQILLFFLALHAQKERKNERKKERKEKKIERINGEKKRR